MASNLPDPFGEGLDDTATDRALRIEAATKAVAANLRRAADALDAVGSSLRDLAAIAAPGGLAEQLEALSAEEQRQALEAVEREIAHRQAGSDVSPPPPESL